MIKDQSINYFYYSFDHLTTATIILSLYGSLMHGITCLKMLYTHVNID